ncbi:MAG: DUF3667 domain-containing protein [Vicingaceae bacterium]|nr:DUF3667 domain-containing protein [Vicingaceae bacterium]
MKELSCPNCGANCDGSYCKECGETTSPKRIGLNFFLSDVLSETLSLEAPLLFTIKRLILNPGKVALEYVRGKRKPYTRPFGFFFLIIGTNYLLSMWLIDSEEVTKMMKELFEAVTSLPAETNLNSYSNDAQITKDRMKELNFLIIPFISLFSWLFFKKSGHNYLENVVLFLFVNGITLFFSIITVLTTLINLKMLIFLGAFVSIATPIYTIWGIVYFHNQKTFWGVVKAIGAYIISMFLFSQAFRLIYNWG